MHKEEEGRLRRQLTIAKVSDGVGNDSKYGVTPLRVRQETAVLMLMNSQPLRQVKKRVGSFPRDLIDVVTLEDEREWPTLPSHTKRVELHVSGGGG